MKRLLALSGAALFGYSIYPAMFWAAIEFILYLVKDDPFNWWSIIIIPILLLLAIVSALISVSDD